MHGSDKVRAAQGDMGWIWGKPISSAIAPQLIRFLIYAITLVLACLISGCATYNAPDDEYMVNPFDDLLDECYDGEVTFRHPAEMEILKSTSIFVRASYVDSTIEPSEGLPGEGVIEQDQATICRTMKAELTGPGFKITPEGGTDARYVPDDGYAQWEWTVTPMEGGERYLYLTLYMADDKGRIGDKTFSRPIEVDVPFSYTASNFVQKWLSPLGISVTAIVTLAGGAFAWWKTKLKKRNKKRFYEQSKK